MAFVTSLPQVSSTSETSTLSSSRRSTCTRRVSFRPSTTRMTLAQPPSPLTDPSSNLPLSSISSDATPDLAEPIEQISGVEEYLDALEKYSDRLLVLQIFAPWCRSCRALYPKVNRLAHEFPEVKFIKLNFEQNRQLCARIGVVSMPTFVFYYGEAGEVEKFSCGPKRAGILREKLLQCVVGRCSLPES